MTECMHCHRDLSKVEEIHAVHGELFCSRECAIEHITSDIIMNAKQEAIAIYDNNSEVVNPADIGLVEGA